MINQISTATSTGFGGKPASKSFDLDADGLAALFCLPLTPPDAPKAAPQDPQPTEVSAILPETQVLGSPTSDSPQPDTINGSQKVFPAIGEIVPDAQTSNSEIRLADYRQDETVQLVAQTQTSRNTANLAAGDLGPTYSPAGMRGRLAQIIAGQKASPKFSDVETDSPLADDKPTKVPGQSSFLNNATPTITEPIESKIADQFKQILSKPEIDISAKPEAPQKDTENRSPENIAINPSEQTALATKDVPEAAAGTSVLSKALAEQIEPRFIALASSMQASGDKRILKMRLHPAELGNVEITLEKNSSGAITARFQTESEQTRQILDHGLEHLRKALEHAGFQVAELNISHDASLAAGGDAQKNSPRNFGRAEQRSASDGGPDGVLTNEDEHNDRLVNLRA